MRLKVLIGGAALLLAGTSGVDAQLGDLLKQGQGALGGITGGGSGSGGGSAGKGLSDSTINDGLKEALRVGTDKVVAQLGQPGGFADDPAIRIPLPGQLETARGALSAAGMGGMADDLELRMNRAAEQAIPEAQELFIEAIGSMSIGDARGILGGPSDSATRYFQEKMTPELSTRMAPIVDGALADAGAIQAYDSMVGEYEQLPFVSGLKGNLNDYVVDQGLEGLFHYVAIQEEAIRENPAARTTDLLKTVFGN